MPALSLLSQGTDALCDLQTAACVCIWDFQGTEFAFVPEGFSPSLPTSCL